MRLGRSDSQAVRNICIRALADLAAPSPSATEADRRIAKQRIVALRNHHVSNEKNIYI